MDPNVCRDSASEQILRGPRQQRVAEVPRRAALLVRSGVTDAAAIPLGVVVGIMLMAGLAAAVGPARRGLRIQPMDALREE